MNGPLINSNFMINTYFCLLDLRLIHWHIFGDNSMFDLCCPLAIRPLPFCICLRDSIYIWKQEGRAFYLKVNPIHLHVWINLYAYFAFFYKKDFNSSIWLPLINKIYLKKNCIAVCLSALHISYTGEQALLPLMSECQHKMHISIFL